MTRLSEDADRAMTKAVERYGKSHEMRRLSKRIIELMSQLTAQLSAQGDKLLGELEETINAREAASQAVIFIAGMRYGRERFVVKLARALREF